MTPTSAAAAIRAIRAARTARHLFDGRPADAAAARRARRGYRALVALIHPDLAAANRIDPADAVDATARLNQLFEQWRDQDAKLQPAEPHVVGDHGTYVLRTRVRRTDRISTYGTDRRDVSVAVSRAQPRATDAVLQAARALGAQGLGAFGPDIVDRGQVDGRAWVAYRIPAGLHSLREVRAAYPRGLDGRDWAWMVRRILMAVAAADGAHADVGLDTVLIQPEQHGVMLTGWGGAGIPPLLADGDAAVNGPGIAGLFDAMLHPSETRQREFAASAVTLPPRRWLAEYDLLLRHLYGARRHRPFSLPRTA